MRTYIYSFIKKQNDYEKNSNSDQYDQQQQEVLDEADDILGEELEELNKYSKFCYTPSEIGKPFGLEGRDLNSFLADKGIIRWVGGRWRLTQKYLHQDLTEDRFRYVHGRDGRRKLESSLVWTEKGREFVLGLIRN